MTAATAALARCDGSRCDTWLPADQTERVGRLVFRGRCATWERRSREAEADEQRAAATAALISLSGCHPGCVPCRHGLAYEVGRTHEIDGRTYGHKRVHPPTSAEVEQLRAMYRLTDDGRVVRR